MQKPSHERSVRGEESLPSEEGKLENFKILTKKLLKVRKDELKNAIEADAPTYKEGEE